MNVFIGWIWWVSGFIWHISGQYGLAILHFIVAIIFFLTPED